MKSKALRSVAFLLSFVCISTLGFTQKKTNVTQPQKKQTTQKNNTKSGNKTAGKDNKNQTITKFTPEQIEDFRQQSSGLVKYFEGTLNFLADKRNPVREKEIIINDSYQKIFLDSKVQVEDDLDEKRLVPLYKDVPAYLSDVDFFFKRVKFLYTLQDVSVMTNDIGQTYFKVTANRNLMGITVNNDSVNSNKVRYFEINYDENKKELKIASIYTTKLNERDDMRNWWNGLASNWKDIFGKDRQIDQGIALSQVVSFNDTVAQVGGSPVPIDAARFYAQLLQLITLKEIDISGNAGLTDLEPLSKISSLIKVDVSNCPVSDLMPLRNLNQLEDLTISGTQVSSLEPLRYSNHLRILKMKKTPVKNIGVLSELTGLENLDLSNTPVDSLEAISELTALKDLRFSGTKVSSLKSLSGLTNLEILYFTNTPVTDLSPLKNLVNLQLVFFDNTGVQSLDVFEKIPGIKKIYCDNTRIDPDKGLQFMLRHPMVDLVFESEILSKWWAAMQAEWKKVFNLYRKLDNNPSTEQLHRLVTLDSLNINGRLTITTLDPVSKLTRLRVLECASTAVNNFEPLRDLTELARINATNTKVKSLEPLSKLRNLMILILDNTPVNDISPLNGLKQLKFIYADNTGLTPEQANSFMSDHPQCLVISQTYENTSWWGELSQAWKEDLLRYFSLSGNPDKLQLQQIAGTEKLVISEDPRIISLQPVVKLSRLKELEISDTRISSLEPLKGMKKLQVIRLTKDPVTEIGSLAALTNLHELDISNTQVEDLMPVQNLRSLETLKFAGTPVRNLKYLQNLTGLKVLEFYNTKVSNIDVLNAMSGLKSLKIFNTKISEKHVEKFKQSHRLCEVVFY